jgi:hypothetical protein
LGCEDDRKKSADSRLAVVIKANDVSTAANDHVSTEVKEENLSPSKTPKIQRIKQVSGTSRHQVPQLNVTDNQEGCSSDHVHPKCNLIYDSHGQEFHYLLLYIYI